MQWLGYEIDGKLIDHRDGNGLNNLPSNLRIATSTENSRNRRKNSNNQSGYKGVCWCARKWRAAIRVNGKLKHLGYFENVTDAALAYDVAAIHYFGEFAHLNFPQHTAA